MVARDWIWIEREAVALSPRSICVRIGLYRLRVCLYFRMLSWVGSHTSALVQHPASPPARLSAYPYLTPHVMHCPSAHCIYYIISL